MTLVTFRTGEFRYIGAMTGIVPRQGVGGDLLGPEDPPAVSILNPDGGAPAVLLCDHASNRVPSALNELGLDEAARSRHIAWDIGAAEVTRHLADLLDAPALLSGYSRLVVDCNRAMDDPTAMRQISDGTIVPGNRGLDANACAQRAAACYWPYHSAVTATIGRVAARGVVPAVISIHTCTPVMKGFERPWHIGVLSNADRRMADLMIAELSRDSALCIGDNQPYSGLDPHGYSIETHALPAGRLNVLLEIRQDLVDTQHGAEHWAVLVGRALQAVMAHPELARAIGTEVREAS
ncbi:MAG: N-formylglutamate amidohydrolase [Alphaproteobacteria bacterium]|nr:N-formylglutamate amidohydrolase [Alphaproteobacteria bacterium]